MSFFGFPTNGASQQQRPPVESEYDAKNDETFGDGNEMMAQNMQTFSPFQQSAASAGGQRPPAAIPSLADIEAAQFGRKSAHGAASSAAAVPSLADVERKLMQPNAQRPQAGRPVESSPPVPAPAPVVAAATPSEEQEDNPLTMTTYEKQFIARIQLSQLVSDETYEDDFYNRLYQWKQRSSARKSAPAPKTLEEVKPGQEAAPFTIPSTDSAMRVSEESAEERFQQLLSDAKAMSRPKATQLAIEGALGHIPINSLRNPKQIVQIQAPAAPTAAKTSTPRSVQKTVLLSIEAVYAKLLRVEALYREWEATKEAGKPASSEQQVAWNQEYTITMKDLWYALTTIGQTDAAKESTLPLTSILAKAPSELSISRMLSFSKGRKVMARVLRFLPKEQNLLLLRSVFGSLKAILLTANDPVAVLQEMTEYANLVVYPFVPVIAEASMDYLNDIMKPIVSNGKVVQLARTKPGLLFLTLFVSRAEILRQQATHTTDPIAEWTDKIFTALFGVFQTRFTALFPPSHILPPIVTSTMATIPQPIAVDDTYVWQFLAAVAVGATPDQQRLLISEVREKLFETVSTQGQKGRDKANILLNALGLDASQLSV